jgi:hypothetical protein
MVRSIRGRLPQRAGVHARGGVMKGCLIALAVVVVLALAGGIYVYFQWRGIVGGMVREVAAQAIEKSALAEDDKKGMMEQIDRMIVAFEEDKLSQANIERFFNGLARSPLVHVGVIAAVEATYIDNSGLPDAEKEAGKLALQRFARGVFEKTIDKDKAKELWSMLTEKDAEGATKMKEQLTDEELNELITKAEDYADQANVPNEPFKIDIVGEFRKAVDEALNEAPAPQP